MERPWRTVKLWEVTTGKLLSSQISVSSFQRERLVGVLFQAKQFATL